MASDRRAAMLERIRRRSPGLHHFLTTDDPKTAKRRGWARDAAVFAVILLVGGSLLWGLTGQPFPEAPVVVIESGSMMQCANIRGTPDANQCDAPFGRLGTIDPGDLIFVQDVERRGDVATYAGAEAHRYNNPGDVIIYYPGGNEAGTPIIHRAMFWLEIHRVGDLQGPDGNGTGGGGENGTTSDGQNGTGAPGGFQGRFDPQVRLNYDIPALGLYGLENLTHPVLNDAPYRLSPGLHDLLQAFGAGPEDSGFITLGDNNLVADQGGNPRIGPMPVQPDWILGKARGELPWIGVAKLFVTDFMSGAGHFARAPWDSKLITFSVIAGLIVVPWWLEKREKRRIHDEEEAAAMASTSQRYEAGAGQDGDDAGAPETGHGAGEPAPGDPGEPETRAAGAPHAAAGAAHEGGPPDAEADRPIDDESE